MASELEFRSWLEALVRQNEKEPLGYPERLELESHLLAAFKESKTQEKRAYEALDNQINYDKDFFQQAIVSLRKAGEEKEQLEQQLAQAQALAASQRATCAMAEEQYAVEHEHLGQARALLELLTSDDAEPILSDVNGYTCIICDTRVDDYEIEHFPHALECFWLKARAFLAEPPQ